MRRLLAVPVMCLTLTGCVPKPGVIDEITMVVLRLGFWVERLFWSPPAPAPAPASDTGHNPASDKLAAHVWGLIVCDNLDMGNGRITACKATETGVRITYRANLDSSELHRGCVRLLGDMDENQSGVSHLTIEFVSADGNSAECGY